MGNAGAGSLPSWQHILMPGAQEELREAVWHWWGFPRALHADRPASSSSSASFSCNPWESDFHLLFLTIKGHESTLVGSGEVFHVPL